MDPIADMLTRIRNAQKTRKVVVEIMASKVNKRIAELLLENGFITEIAERAGMPKRLVLTLKYVGGVPAIQEIKRESSPGHRKYCKATELPRVLNDYGIAIISTPNGIMTNKNARTQGIGGEVMCSVY